jgi:peptidyl-prolyl cis-trans isomerase A (cyclophilin A)
MNPASMKDKAPETFRAKFETTQGEFVVELTRAWSPHGVDRFYNLVKYGYYDGIKFFRVVPNFVVQFGIHGDPAVSKNWMNSNIPDDPVKESNKKGYVTYAKSGQPNSRSTQLFINLNDNAGLDAQGFAPIGRVVQGMDVVEKFYSEYGDKPTSQQGQMWAEGNVFLLKNYPQLDSIKKAYIMKGEAQPESKAAPK